MNQLAMPFPAQAHKRLRHRKATEATEKATADIPQWADLAYAFLCRFAVEREQPFLTEELRYRSRGHVPQPENPAAWGGVVLRAARAGVIVRAGWSTATRSAGVKPVWKGGLLRGQ